MPTAGAIVKVLSLSQVAHSRWVVKMLNFPDQMSNQTTDWHNYSKGVTVAAAATAAAPDYT